MQPERNKKPKAAKSGQEAEQQPQPKLRDRMLRSGDAKLRAGAKKDDARPGRWPNHD